MHYHCGELPSCCPALPTNVAARVSHNRFARDAFERLMGPVEEILAQKIEEYKKFNEEALAQHV